MNLLAKLHRNSILTGPIENYCLVCGCLLRSEEESYAHIHEPSHVDKLSSLPQLVDYNDCIIKIKEGYFCRYCNLILPTIKRVGIHVTESKHKDNKISLSITRYAGVILAFDSVVINDRSWNGLDGSTCSVCNEDYDDEEEHKKSSTHVLNLIQIKCEFGETYVYRKVDEELFFCLICNAILPFLEKQTHHESEKHLENFEKSKAEGTSIRNKKVPAVESVKLTPAPKEPNNIFFKTTIKPNSQILDSKKTDIKLGFLNKNIPTQTIKTEKETAKVNAQISKEAPNKNTQELKDKPKPVNKDERKNEAAKVEVDKVPKVINEVNGTSRNQAVTDEAEPYLYEFLKARNFVIKAHDSASYCTICDVNIEQTCADSHCRDEHHKMLYSKHIARRTKLSKLDNVSNPSEKHGESKADKSEAATDKENVAPVSGQNCKFAEAKRKIVVKESRDTVKGTAPIKSSVVPLTNDKKPTVSNSVTMEKTTTVIEPINKENNSTSSSETETKHQKQTDKESENRSNEKNKGDIKQEPTETTAPNKKAVKKIQKKTAKAKASETDTDVQENKTALAKVCEQRTKETPTTASELLSGDSTNVEASDTKETQDCKQKDQEKAMAKFPPEAEIKTEKLLSLLKTVSHIDSACDVVINGKIVLGNLSFVLILRTEYEAQCVVCNENFSVDDVNWHVTTDNHRANVEDCLVVTSLEDEFIRQVKSQGYHCGYCNALIPTWADMEHHLSSYGHEDAKTSAAWRLELYMPLIRLVGTREVRSILNTIFKCTSE